MDHPFTGHTIQHCAIRIDEVIPIITIEVTQQSNGLSHWAWRKGSNEVQNPRQLCDVDRDPTGQGGYHFIRLSSGYGHCTIREGIIDIDDHICDADAIHEHFKSITGVQLYLH